MFTGRIYTKYDLCYHSSSLRSPYANSGLYHPPKHNYQECHLLSTIFAWKTACQKYFFRIFSQTRAQGDESQKSELGFDLKNPHAVRVDVMDS